MGREDQDHRHHRGAAKALVIRRRLDQQRLLSVEIFRTRFIIGTFVPPKRRRAWSWLVCLQSRHACRIEFTTVIRTEPGSV